MKAVAAGLVTLAGIVSADVALYGQCGGINYTGETTCVAGAHCQYMNDYYSQCLAGYHNDNCDNYEHKDDNRRDPSSHNFLID
ncbi:hypothetical protein ONZ43_g7762 [Nemania bipapillata]|uniref:Uncharacterized protein n=1 Tax=Nemania bipapillata TaxID=110536 RepID=A0ACC2HPC5_9PEZI|nr:hypothetical protein ONZ43_g7762 [Nemania bipapillata]